ncbi:MAG: Gfo/Idh/MocA family oxidoreductase [Pleurocapsa sp.]
MFSNAIAPIKVGIVGTGYAAKKRAEAIKADKRAELIAVSGNTAERVSEFAQIFSISPVNSWQQLVNLEELDLIFVCTINRDCGAIARAAIDARKHVVVEYPLAIDPKLAEEIIDLATAKNKLLHVEHIELIGGLHQAIQQNLAQIGQVYYARYATISPKNPAPRRWNYHKEMYGFPLTAALSRIHRLTNLFGTVDKVVCHNRYWDVKDSDYFTACLCNAQLHFSNNIVADITYGKGDVFCYGHRTFEIHGDRGTLLFEGETGTLIQGKEKTEIPVTSRCGLFAKDTALVLDCLLENKPLYVKPQESLYALQVADAARRVSEI